MAQLRHRQPNRVMFWCSQKQRSILQKDLGATITFGDMTSCKIIVWKHNNMHDHLLESFRSKAVASEKPLIIDTLTAHHPLFNKNNNPSLPHPHPKDATKFGMGTGTDCCVLISPCIQTNASKKSGGPKGVIKHAGKYTSFQNDRTCSACGNIRGYHDQYLIPTQQLYQLCSKTIDSYIGSNSEGCKAMYLPNQ